MQSTEIPWAAAAISTFSPSSPLSAAQASNVHDAICSDRMERFTWLSSTIRMRAPVTSEGVMRLREWPALGSVTVNQNVEPWPSVLSTPISPPISCTSREVIANPSPVPSCRRVEEASTWLNLSNTAASLSAGMPIPVSVTAMRILVPSSSAHAAGVDQNMAGVGELHGIADEIGDDLPDTADIADIGVGKAGLDAHDQFEILLLRPRRDQCRHVLDRLRECEGRRIEHELPGVDLREVEDVVDDCEQRVAGFDDDLGEGLLLGIEFRPGEKFGHAKHAVHRRPDLVAHIGEEFGLGAVGKHGPALRLLQLPLALLLFRHVDRRAEQIERAVGGDHRALARHLITYAAARIGDGLLDFLALAREQYGAVVLHEGETVVARYLEVGLADRLFGGNAGQLRPVLIDVDELQILALGVDRHRHVVDQAAEYLVFALAFLEPGLTRLHLGDVGARADQMHRAVAGDEPALLGDQLARAAVPVRQRFFNLVGHAGAQNGEVALGESVALRREEIAVGTSGCLLL